MKIQKKNVFFFGGGGGGVGFGGGGGQDGCERRIEVSVKVQNQRTNGKRSPDIWAYCKYKNK